MNSNPLFLLDHSTNFPRNSVEIYHSLEVLLCSMDLSVVVLTLVVVPVVFVLAMFLKKKSFVRFDSGDALPSVFVSTTVNCRPVRSQLLFC